MVVRVNVNFKGVDELLEDLAKLGQDVDRAAAKAVTAGGDEILDGMLANVPVGDASKGDPHPGQLMATLKRTAPEMDGNFTFVDVGMSAEANADVARYGNAQEYGYRRGGKQYAPQSYIRKGFDEKKAAARKAMKDALRQEGVLNP
jgi:HK97 gp10 family phage protein